MADVHVERVDDVVWIRLQNPRRRNAFNVEMTEKIIAAFEDAGSAYAVVLTGSEGSFCAGGSLDQLGEPDAENLRKLFAANLRLVEAIRACPRPVIAAVNGAAAGGGNELVIACDFAVAAESATFGQTGPKVGSSPVLGGTNLLAIQIGEKRSKEMAMLCRRYSAEQALEWGFVNDVVEDDRLEERVWELIAEIKRLSPRYLEITKINSNIWWNQSLDSVRNGLGMLVQAIGSDDMLEGANAFLEKRRPVFPAPGGTTNEEA